MFEASKGCLGGGAELAVLEASLELTREAWARGSNLGGYHPWIVVLWRETQAQVLCE